MASLEREPQRQLTPEEMAAEQIDGYLERVEKQVEIDKDVANMVQQQPQMPPVIADEQGMVVAEAVPENPIDLPLTQAELEEDLHHPFADAARWLAEFCVMIIKKYPGRVFYRRQTG